MGAFLGAKLGSLIVQPQTQAAVALSSVGSAVGAFAFTPIASGGAGLLGTGGGSWLLGNLVLPGVGALVGFVLGALIGNLFGHKKPRTPTASAETVLQLPYAHYQLGAVTSANAGNVDLVKAMALTAVNTLNGLIANVVPGDATGRVSNLNGLATDQRYGHRGGQLYVTINGTEHDFDSADQAVEYGTLTAIKNTKIIGGDIFAKRAIYRSPADSLTSIAGDLKIADDYRFFTQSRDLVQQSIVGAYATLTQAEQDYYTLYPDKKVLVDKLATQGSTALTTAETNTYNGNKASIDRIVLAVQNQALANPWIITLQRANELKLDQFAPSDFYGGLKGFLQSFNLEAAGAHYEDMDVVWRGGPTSIEVRDSATSSHTTLDVNAAGAQVYRLYDAALGRAPDAGGWTSWAALLERGTTLESFAASTIASAEFQARYGSSLTNDQFVDRVLYQGVLRRAADSSGRSAFITQLNSGVSRASLLVLFSEGAEHRAMYDGLLGGDINSDDAFIVRMYDTAFARAPTDGEVGVWINYLRTMSRSACVALMMTDAGFNARWNIQSNDDFITKLYLAAFRRNPTSDELLVWRNSLASGTTRVAMFYELSENQAYHHTFTDPGIARGLSYADRVGEALFNQLTTSTSDGRGVTVADLAAVGVVPVGWNQVGPANNYTDVRGNGGALTIDDNSNNNQGGDDIGIATAFADTLRGRSGADWLDGQGGNDWIEGGDDSDVLIGGEGVDHLEGGNGDDYISGGLGDDQFSGALLGQAGNDTLVGGVGNDALDGGPGDDLLIADEDGGGTWDWLAGGGDTEGSDTVSFERFSFGLFVDMRTPKTTTSGRSGMMTYGDFWVSIENITGSALSDTFYGDAGNNVLKGLGSNDTLWGAGGDDVLEGGPGADYLDGGDGNDTISYASSAAAVFVDLTTGTALGGDAQGDNAFYVIENLQGSTNNDELRGTSGANRIDGGGGDDILDYSGGGDAFLGGDGFDTVDYSKASAPIYESWDPNRAHGIFIDIDRVTGYGPGERVAYHDTYTGIESFIGTPWFDEFRGGSADEVFDGGAGGDYLWGRGGSDTYVFGRGYGVSTIDDDNTGSNTIRLKSDVLARDLWFGAQGGSSGYLDIGIRGTTDKLHINANFANSPVQNKTVIKTLDFSGYAQIDMGDTSFMTGGGTGNDSVIGLSSQYNFLAGFEGNDTFNSSSWSDKGSVYIGGLDNDVIYSSTGDDQFVYDAGDGQDVVNDSGGEDTLVFGPSVAATDIIYKVVGNDLYIGVKDVNNPTYDASQVASRVRVIGGGAETDTGTTKSWNTVEIIQAAGTSIDVRKLDLGWTVYRYGGGGGQHPIVLDLQDDGLDLTSVADSKIVVQNDEGVTTQLGWAGPTDGYLAVDRNGDGQISRLSEISFVQDRVGAKTDLDGLKAWDTNADGVLDQNDTGFGQLRLWVDGDQNGRSSSGELRTLAQAGITSLSLVGSPTGSTGADTPDNYVSNTIAFSRSDGSVGTGYDVTLGQRFVGQTWYGVPDGLTWADVGTDGELGRLNDSSATAAGLLNMAAAQAVDDEATVTHNRSGSGLIDFSGLGTLDVASAARWADRLDPVKIEARQDAEERGYDVQVSAKIKNTPPEATVVVAPTPAVDSPSLPSTSAPVVEAPSPSISDASSSLENGSSVSGTVSTTRRSGELQPTSDAMRAAFDTASMSGWWKHELEEAGKSGRSILSASFAPLTIAELRPARTVAASDAAAAQRQLLLRQSLASLHGDAGSSMPMWRQSDYTTSALAASAGRSPGISSREPVGMI